jgi:2-polyprenyl-3-methyl-5-hydroxy-6-metoxy-1,4-benzoquinol methylase
MPNKDPIWLNYYIVLARTLKDIANPKTVLDIGCNDGSLVRAFCRMNCKAWGCETSKEAILRAPPNIRNRLLNVDITKDALPFEDATFDLITMIDVIEHLENRGWLEEITRILKPKGYLYVSTPRPGFILPSGNVDPTHVNVHAKRFWMALFSENGYVFRQRFPKTARIKALSFLWQAPPFLWGNSIIRRTVLFFCRYVPDMRSNLIFQKS